MDDFVYDRTRADVFRVEDLQRKLDQGTVTEAEKAEMFGDPKGALNVSDLNRIEEWCQYLTDYLNRYGYGVKYEPYAGREWQMKDIPYRSEIDRIRSDVDALQAGFYSLPDWREIIYNNTLNFEQVNALEWDLQRIYDWLEKMVANLDFVRCGELYGGEI